MYINSQSKGTDGDSRDLPNAAASRGWCKPGVSSRFSNITPEPQHLKREAAAFWRRQWQKEQYAHAAGVRSDACPALRDAIYGALITKGSKYVVTGG